MYTHVRICTQIYIQTVLYLALYVPFGFVEALVSARNQNEYNDQGKQLRDTFCLIMLALIQKKKKKRV